MRLEPAETHLYDERAGRRYQHPPALTKARYWRSRMAKKPIPTPDELRQLLRYEPQTGQLFWRARGPEWFTASWNITAEAQAKCWNARWAGTEALTLEKNGYRYGPVLGAKLYAHRVAFALYHGRWPGAQIDHIDRNRRNNTPENLRETSPAGNMMNVSRNRRNTSGVTGVSWSRALGKWRACFGRTHVGYFEDLTAAARAVQQARIAAGFSESHGA